MKRKFTVAIILLALLASSCTQKYPLELGEGYKIDYDGNSYLYLLDKSNTVIIKSNIVSFNFNSIFVLINQKPVDLILDSINKTPNVTLKKSDEFYTQNSFRQYWILNKKTKTLYGPYKKNQYFQKRKELAISNKFN